MVEGIRRRSMSDYLRLPKDKAEGEDLRPSEDVADGGE